MTTPSPLGYQGNTGFWGTDTSGQPKNNWWNQDMADAGQALYADPNSAVLSGTMPAELLARQQELEEYARAARGGVFQSLSLSIGALDKNLSKIPGWGVVKGLGKAVWYPVDKLATGAYWLYSNAVSQPLSTLLIQSSKAELAEGGFWGNGLDTLMSGDEWSDAYGKAEHISPAQAFMNYENTANASGKGTALGLVAGGADAADKEAVQRNTERFLYDTDYWRSKQGWTYTVGTGALDFMISMGADPVYAGVKVGAAAVKGSRSIKVGEQVGQSDRFGRSTLTTAVANKIGQALAKTPEEASRSTKVNKFFDWSDGKTAAEIAQHPIWGRGRRVNPASNQISEVMANASRDEKPLLFRFAMGDNKAAAELVEKNADLLTQVGKMEDNRVLVDSIRFSSEIYQHFLTSNQPDSRFPLLTDIPPRPEAPGPRQSGWDQTYGKMAKESEIFSQAASHGLSGVRPLGPAAQTSFADVLRAEEWKAGKLQEMDTHLAAYQEKSNYYGSVLGSLATKLDDFSPGQSNLFGTVKSLYRQGPLALRDTSKAGDKAVAKLGSGKGDWAKEGGFATRLIRNGFYTAPVRVVQSFGERTPERLIDHNADDAYQRVAEMLKQVPGLGQDTRLDMIRSYSQAGDKTSRSKVLEDIHSQVIEHMATNVHGLDAATARTINQMRQVGFQKTMMALTGTKNPEQMFSAAVADADRGMTAANRVDHVEDGEGYVISPLAKTQLQAAEPLLPVRELDRLLSRNSGMLQSLKRGGGTATDNVNAALDSLNTVWKAATLLRPGYVLRSMSEEQVASAVKFGIISSMADLGKGGYNWFLNRQNQVFALTGEGSYASASQAGKAKVRIVDEAALQAAENQGLQVSRINVGKAWPVIQARISDERKALAEIEKQIKGARKDQDVSSLTAQAADHQAIIDEHVDYATAILQEAERSKGVRLGEDSFEHQGITVPKAFSKEWENPIPRDQITSARAMETIFARGEAIDNGRIIKTGSWKAVTPDDPNYMTSWLDGLNKQFRQDDLFRLVAEDPTLAKAKAWVKTPAGKYHMSLLGPRAKDTEGTIQAVKQTLDQYLPEGTGLQGKLARNEEIAEHELRAAISPDDFPQVHGEELKALTAMFSKQTAARAIDDLIERGFNRLSTLPNDVMARQPIYLRAQEARMRQLLDQELSFKRENGLSEDLGMDELQNLLNKSDKLARKDISQVVYDPTRTTATEALRFVAPFLSAHVDGLQRWGGLIAEQPQFLGRAARVYNAPVAAGLVTDQYGRPVDQYGNVQVEDVDGKKSKQFVPLERRMLTLRAPGHTTNIKGIGKVATGGTRLSLQALNTILPGDPWFNPGTGPLVQLAGSELARKSPGIGDFLQWSKVLPYGPNANRFDAFTPAYLKDAWNAYTAGDAGNEKYQEAVLSEWQRQSAVHANGGPAPDWKSAQKNAKDFMFMEALGNWLSPARTKDTPLSQTPYQFFLDQYKTLQEADPQNAKANFFKKYGENYFAFTASLSKSIGVQATLPAQHTAEMYGDLIAADPDLAPLIVGDVYNQGKFSNSVYRKQMDTLLNGVQVREKITALDSIKNNQKDLGWQQYNKYMTAIDAELIRSGFQSYNQRGAEAFSNLKGVLVDALAQMYEPWFQDYGTVNTTKMPQRINAMRKLVSDERIMSDPMRAQDLVPLSAYIQQRDALKKALTARGGKKLTFSLDGTPTGDNADIGMQLRTVQLYLVNNSLAFGDIYHRYLESDDLS